MGRKVNWGIIAAGGIARRRTLPAMKDVPNAVITGIMAIIIVNNHFCIICIF